MEPSEKESLQLGSVRGLAVGSAVIGLMFLISWPSAFAAGQQGFSIKVCTSPRRSVLG